MTSTANVREERARPVFARMGWPLMFRAFVAILFAVLAFYWLGASLPNMVMLFAAWCVADAVLTAYAAVQGGGYGERSGLAASAVVSLIAAAVAAFWPGMTWATLALVIGGWAIVRGGLDFANALTLRKYMPRDFSLSLIGLFSVLYGLMLALARFEPAIFVRLLSGYALILGLLMVVLGVRFLRGFRA